VLTSLSVSFVDSLAARRRVLAKDMKMRFINLAGSRGLSEENQQKLQLEEQDQELPGKLEQEQEQSAAATQH